MNSYLVKKN